MDQEMIPLEDKKSFLQNDRLLVCSMFIIYGLCIAGLAGAAIWGLDRRSKEVAANSTSTAAVLATQQAKQWAAATATVVVRSTQQAQYDFMERFDDNRHVWRVESINDELMRGSMEIRGGAYEWDLREIKQPFYTWAPFPSEDWDKDFDTYVDFKVSKESPEDVCGGFLFRRTDFSWEEGTYVFSVCNSSYFYVSYYKQDKWDEISGLLYNDVIQRADWNRLEISARGSHFTFTINDEVVFQMTDDRLPAGRLSLFAEVAETKPTTLWFDNFAFQDR